MGKNITMGPYKSLFVVLIISPLILAANEVDNFSQSYNPLTDSNSVLSEAMNNHLQAAARALNAQNKTVCDGADIMSAVKNEVFTGGNASSIEKLAETDSRIQRHLPLKNSFLKATHSSINLNGHYIGTDKLSHFLGDNKKSTVAVSYADLAAGYEGRLFWNNIFNVKFSENSYFSCQKGQWSQTRNFNWSDYANDAWDEAINCTEYDKATKKLLKGHLEKLTESHKNRKIKNIRFTCPMSSGECMRLRRKYDISVQNGDPVKDLILSPSCINVNISSPHNDIHSSQKAEVIIQPARKLMPSLKLPKSSN